MSAPEDPRKAADKSSCPVCLRARDKPCGRYECPLRESLTAGIPDGLTWPGKVDTKTKEWY